MSRIHLPPLQEETINQSSSQLRQGLQLINKTFASTLQWTAQFTKIQNDHFERLDKIQKQIQASSKKNQFTEKIKKGLSKFTKKICRLCLQQKASENFIAMSSCGHQYCYSCLNVYAISKIQDFQRVNCPHLKCFSEMKLSSPVYKYLPQEIKLKHLQYRLQNKQKNIQLTGKCLRCLQNQHQGQCKVSYNIQKIQSAFNFRKCKSCRTEVKMSQGRKKIQCSKCHNIFCYLCGQNWPQKGFHKCQQNKNVNELEKQVTKDNSCCQNCCSCQDNSCQCCQCWAFECCHLECDCFKNCGKCCGACFYCDQCSPSICIGNVVLMPLRILLSILVFLFYFLMGMPIMMVIFMISIYAVLAGCTIYTYQMICDLDGFLKVLGIVFCPILTLPGICISFKQNGPIFSQMFGFLSEMYSTFLCEMWSEFSPKECCS